MSMEDDTLGSKDPCSSKKKKNRKDPLMTHISHSKHSSLAQHIKKSLVEDGYCVLPSILDVEECESLVDEMWDYVEVTSKGRVQRNDASTWYPAASPDAPLDLAADSGSSESDPWPHSRWKCFPDTFQSNDAGWIMPNLREILAERVFRHLFGTRELHCTKEGFTFHRPRAHPDSYDGFFAHPAYDENKCNEEGAEIFKVCGKEHRNSQGSHCDQGSNPPFGLCHIQSMTSLVEQGPDDGAFMCWPKSHRMHLDLIEDNDQGKCTWAPLTDLELHRMSSAGLEPKRVAIRRGDVILWRSDLAHAAACPPRRTECRFRAVAYVGMLPAVMTEKDAWDRKLEAYRTLRTGDHRTDCEEWQSNSDRVTNYHKYGPPQVSWRQAELYGLVPYGVTPDDKMSVASRATIRGVRFQPDVLDHAKHSPTIDSLQSTSPQHPSSQPLPVPKHNARVVTLAPDDPPLMGQDKWLGGMASPCGRYIYGVPGHARRVFCITVQTEQLTFIGKEYPGKFKWLRGIEVPSSALREHAQTYPSGLLFALPSNANSVLCIDPNTQQVSTFGDASLMSDNWQWHGGNLSPHTGLLYAIPANADRVLCINPRTKETTLIGPVFKGKQKWYGGILASNGCIYGVPQNASRVLKITPQTGEVKVIGEGTLPEGMWKWHGGTTNLDQTVIYGFPNNADTILKIDTVRNDAISFLAGPDILKSGRHRIPQDGKYKYLGGALSTMDKCLYLFPCDAEQVLSINTITEEVKLVGPELLEGENKYQNGFCARDGAVYGIPQRASGVIRVAPTKDHSKGEEPMIDVLHCGEAMVGVKDKFEGGVMGADGCVYCIPLRAKRAIKVIPDDSNL
mmetsp:Transcript_28918/g.42875  ORF Transcript_28918/g.42875 Transcript_28918/m.42875 type:complete len:846 (-) Transcript_28918:51-2588(-)